MIWLGCTPTKKAEKSEQKWCKRKLTVEGRENDHQKGKRMNAEDPNGKKQ